MALFNNKDTNKTKKGIKGVVGAVTSFVAALPIVPIIIAVVLITSIVSTVVSYIVDLFISENTVQNIYKGLEIEDLSELVEIKKNSSGEYYIDFKENIENKLENVIKAANSSSIGSHNLPKDVEFLKEVIKAELVTKFPNLGGDIPEGTSGFQGAVNLRRITPNKKIGEMKNTGKGETSNIEQDEVVDPNENSTEYEKIVKTWKEGDKLYVNADAVFYVQTESELNPGSDTGDWNILYDDNNKKVEIKKGTEVTYTGTYKNNKNQSTNEASTYVEVTYGERTAFIKAQRLSKTKNNVDIASTAKVLKAEDKTITSRAKEETIGDATKTYTIALAATYNGEEGLEYEDLKEKELTIKVANKVEELCSKYSNIKIVQVGNTASNKDKTKDNDIKKAIRDANPDMAIVIYFNYDSEGKASGVDSIYREYDEISHQFADILSENIAKSMGLTDLHSGTDAEKCGGSITTIENAARTKFPAVVTRGGYLNKDAAKIREDGVDNYAKGIFNSIEKYILADKSGYEAVEVEEKTATSSIESKVINMKYVPKETFDQYIQSNNQEALKVFSLDEDFKVLTATWSLKADGSIEISQNTAMDIRTSLQKYTMPYEYLLFFYIDTDYEQFAMDLAKKAQEAEIVLAVQDNVTVTHRVETVEECTIVTPASMARYGKGWSQVSGKDELTENAGTTVDLTYIDTWVVKAYNENSYSEEILKMAKDEEKIMTIKGTVNSTSSTSQTSPTNIDSGTVNIPQNGKDDKDLSYSYVTQQRTTTKTDTISNSYEAGEKKVKGKENVFVDLYKQHNMKQRVRTEWLFQILENNEKTSNLVNLTKYLIFKATNINYGVIEFDFNEYGLSQFKSMSAISGGIPLYEPILSKEDFIKALTEYAATNGAFTANFLPYLDQIYDVSVASHVNPELVIITAYTEQGFIAGGGANNYWGIGVYNGQQSGSSFSSLLDGIRAYAKVINGYNDNPSYSAMIMQRYEQRKDSGCDPLGYGTPDTLSGVQSIYSALGRHGEAYSSSGAGGYYYMDPARAGVTGIYATHEEFLSKCYNAGGEHAAGQPCTVWEEGQYTAFQVKQKMEVWEMFFGQYGTLSSGGSGSIEGDPDFNNAEAWRNPQNAYPYGQCTWFAGGRLYEVYKLRDNSLGNGGQWVGNLCSRYPDKFTLSYTPEPGAIFSATNPSPWGHVGFVKAVNGNEVTIQEGNLDGLTNTWEVAIKDWHEVTYTLSTFRSIYSGLTFANPTSALLNSAK